MLTQVRQGAKKISDSGFEDHPVVRVSWYGAMAFADYYGVRLPTEWEWESVANYNDNRTYATGSSLTVSGSGEAPEDGIAREHGVTWHLANNDVYQSGPQGNTTTPVGWFGYYGYGLSDMTGNLWDWTSTVSGNDRVRRGGCWGATDNRSAVSYRASTAPDIQSRYIGFRVCR